MEGFGVPPGDCGGGAGGGVIPLQEVNSACSNLEQMIKNFRKEKLMYEQKIEGLRGGLQISQERIQNMSLTIQEVAMENQRLQKVHEVDEKERGDLNNKIWAAEHHNETVKEQVLEFETLKTKILRQFDEHEKTIACLKVRQLQLKQWIDEALQNNAVLQVNLDELNDKLNFTEQELTHANVIMKENEKEQKILRDELRNEIQHHLKSLEKEKTAHLATIEGFQTVEGKFIEELKAKEEEEEELKMFIQKLIKDIEEQGEEAAKELEKLTDFIEGKIKQHQEEKEALAREMGALDKTIKTLEADLVAERTTIQSLKEAGVELNLKLVAQESENKMIKQFVEELEEVLKRLKMVAGEEKKDLEMKLEQEKGKRLEERNEFEKMVEEKNKVIMELREQLESEKSALDGANAAKSALTEELESKKMEAEGLKLDIEKLKREMEEQKKVEDEKQAKLKKDLELAESKLEELNLKIKACNEHLKEETAKHEAAIQELHQVDAKFKEELAAKESSIKTLMEQLEEKKMEITGQTENFAKEKVEMEQEFRKELRALDEEKAKLDLDYTMAVEKLEKKLDQTKKERNDLQKRCQEQTLAIAKMAVQARVRQVEAALRSRTPSTPEVSVPPRTPRTSLLKPVSKPDPMTTPSSSGILKHQSFYGGDGDKNTKNVTFGSTLIVDFMINSGTDDSQGSGEQKKKAPSKRMRYHEEKRDIGPPTPSQEDNKEMDEEEEEETAGVLTQQEKPGRRFSKRKRGIAQKKSPNSTF